MPLGKPRVWPKKDPTYLVTLVSMLTLANGLINSHAGQLLSGKDLVKLYPLHLQYATSDPPKLPPPTRQDWLPQARPQRCATLVLLQFCIPLGGFLIFHAPARASLASTGIARTESELCEARTRRSTSFLAALSNRVVVSRSIFRSRAPNSPAI